MDAATRSLVWQRAGNLCEYCRMPQEAVPLIPFHVEHIVARQHEGSDRIDNLSLACDRCNAYKGPNLTSLAPDTGEIVPLFNPRQDAWNDHFCFDGGTIVGLTPIGQATVRLLNMNAPRRVQLREQWLQEGGTL
jgi:hypothetical protein